MRSPALFIRPVLERFLARRSENTRRAYAQHLQDFAEFCGARSPEGAVRTLCCNGGAAAVALVDQYMRHLEHRGLSTSTRAARLTALKALVKIARAYEIGDVDLSLVEAPKRERGTGNQGPRAEEIAVMRRALEKRKGKKGARDRAIFVLLAVVALRRAEVVDLDREDLKGDSLQVRRKGREGKEAVPLDPAVIKALQEWIGLRGDEPGPLFYRCDGRGGRWTQARISSAGLYKMIRTLSMAAIGRALNPHSFRHSTATLALRLGIPIDAAADALGDKCLDTVRAHYRDGLRRENALRVQAVMAAL